MAVSAKIVGVNERYDIIGPCSSYQQTLLPCSGWSDWGRDYNTQYRSSYKMKTVYQLRFKLLSANLKPTCWGELCRPAVLATKLRIKEDKHTALHYKPVVPSFSCKRLQESPVRVISLQDEEIPFHMFQAKTSP